MTMNRADVLAEAMSSDVGREALCQAMIGPIVEVLRDEARISVDPWDGPSPEDPEVDGWLRDRHAKRFQVRKCLEKATAYEDYDLRTEIVTGAPLILAVWIAARCGMGARVQIILQNSDCPDPSDPIIGWEAIVRWQSVGAMRGDL